VEQATGDSGMQRTRQEIVRTQLARAGVGMADALRELREILIGLATEMDALDRRIKELEAKRPRSLRCLETSQNGRGGCG
jgi:hypothetical protein